MTDLPFVSLVSLIVAPFVANTTTTTLVVTTVTQLLEATPGDLTQWPTDNAVESQLVSHVQSAEDLHTVLLSGEKAVILPRLHKLNKQLEPVMYLVDNHFSMADLATVAALGKTVATWTDAEFFTFFNISRWYDLIQHHPKLTQVLTDLGFFVTIKRNVPKEDPNKPKQQQQNQPKQQQNQPKQQQNQNQNQNQAGEGKKQPQQQQQQGKGKGGGGGGGPAAAKPDDIYRCDIRVGKIVHCEKHPDAATLYKETIDLGDADGPRTVISGLVKYVPLDEMQGRLVLCLCNIKPANMRGIKSEAMVLVASDSADEAKKELLDPPAGSVPGDKVFFEGHAGPLDGQINLSSKGNIFAKCQVDLKTNSEFIACWKGIPMQTDKGVVTSVSVADGLIG